MTKKALDTDKHKRVLIEILNESQKTWAKDHLISETIKELGNLK